MDLTRVQGNIVPGFGKPHQAMALLAFPSRTAGQTWLRTVRGGLTSAADVYAAAASTTARAAWLNVTFSWQGLQVLLGQAGVAGMPSAFVTNRVPFCEPLADVHAMLHLAASDAAGLDASLQQHRATLNDVRIREVRLFRGQTLGRGMEHFGFRDGVSRVLVQGVPEPTPFNGVDDGETPLAPGEFFFGEPDGAGRRILPGPEWTRGGSFMAFMQLEQDVAAFRAATARAGQRLGVSAAQCAARVVGRTADGDIVGGVPPMRLSHIGRARPRWIPASARSRIIRRGIPYGAPLAADGATDSGERGLLFVSYQADLVRQFEQVWRIWLNDRAFPGPGASPDGLVGQPLNGTAQRTVTLSRTTLTAGVDQVSMPSFVKPHYGGYFLVPPIPAFTQLGGG